MAINLEIIAMVYKSTSYLEFIEDQMLRFCEDFDDIKVSLRIIANDPTPNIVNALLKLKIPHCIYHDPKPEDYYLNRVYRCWNFGAISSESDLICFINSDMAFSHNWLKPLVDLHKNNYLPVPRLVESGKLLSGTHAYSCNFGRNPKEFNESEWLRFVRVFKEDKFLSGGLYMPVIFDREEFILAGTYPEGNVLGNEIGSRTYEAIGGDVHFFKKFSELTERQHVCAFNSLVYHIQEGELDA